MFVLTPFFFLTIESVFWFKRFLTTNMLLYWMLDFHIGFFLNEFHWLRFLRNLSIIYLKCWIILNIVLFVVFLFVLLNTWGIYSDVSLFFCSWSENVPLLFLFYIFILYKDREYNFVLYVVNRLELMKM